MKLSGQDYNLLLPKTVARASHSLMATSRVSSMSLRCAENRHYNARLLMLYEFNFRFAIFAISDLK